MLSFQQRSRDITLLSSPEPSVSMSVSITTPGSQIPSIHSQLATIVSEPLREILTHDVNKLLSYLHDTNTVCDAQHAELMDHLHVIEDELLDLSDMLHRRVAEVHVHIPECHGNLTVPHLRIIFSLTSRVVRDSTTSGSPALPVSTPWKLQHLDSRDPTDGWPLSSSTSTLSAMKGIPASPRANQMHSLWG